MLVLAGLVLLGWVVQAVLAVRIVRAVPSLATLPKAQRASWPRISMVVPARDEARGIAAALASKLACGYPDLEVVAVDDRSRDATGALIDAAAAADARVVPVHVTELPDGWLGKLNAMARGLERCTGEWVLFSDADVHVEPGTLERIVAWADREQVDFVAAFPKMHPVSMLIDAALVVMMRVLVITGRGWRANDDASGLGVGVGAFGLARRGALQKTRAIEHLRMEVVDDVALGALLKGAGYRCRFFAGREDLHIVFQDSLGAMARSTDKAGGLVGFTLWGALLAAFAGPALDLAVPLAAIAHGGVARTLGVATLALITATQALLMHHFRGPVRGVVAWPLGQLLMAAFMLRAGLKAWRDQGISWRHTFYPRAVLEAGRRLDPRTMKVRLPPEG